MGWLVRMREYPSATIKTEAELLEKVRAELEVWEYQRRKELDDKFIKLLSGIGAENVTDPN